jgi:hypothetical protein
MRLSMQNSRQYQFSYLLFPIYSLCAKRPPPLWHRKLQILTPHPRARPRSLATLRNLAPILIKRTNAIFGAAPRLGKRHEGAVAVAWVARIVGIRPRSDATSRATSVAGIAAFTVEIGGARGHRVADQIGGGCSARVHVRVVLSWVVCEAGAGVSARGDASEAF